MDKRRLSAVERSLIQATQAGLPLDIRPFDRLSAQLGLDTSEVMEHFQTLTDTAVVRRIGAVPNHYRLGYTANGMSVWDVSDKVVDTVGREVAALEFVTHCYRRPRRLPLWPYNLFAMVHGYSRDEVETKVELIKELLGEHAHSHDVLYSKRVLKKKGLRIKET